MPLNVRLIVVKDILIVASMDADSLPYDAFTQSTLLTLAGARGLYIQQMSKNIDELSGEFTQLFTEQFETNLWTHRSPRAGLTMAGSSTLTTHLNGKNSLADFLERQTVEPLQSDLKSVFQLLNIDSYRPPAGLDSLLKLWWSELNQYDPKGSSVKETQFSLASVNCDTSLLALTISTFGIAPHDLHTEPLEEWRSLFTKKGAFTVRSVNYDAFVLSQKNFKKAFNKANPHVKNHLDLIQTHLLNGSSKLDGEDQ